MYFNTGAFLMVTASCSFCKILSECIITVHCSVKSKGVKSATVLAVSNSCANHKNVD